MRPSIIVHIILKKKEEAHTNPGGQGTPREHPKRYANRHALPDAKRRHSRAQ